MAAEPGPREDIARVLTDAVLADMAKIDELLGRVRDDVGTLERWGAPMALTPEWRERLGLEAEIGHYGKIVRTVKNARGTLADGELMVAGSPEMRVWVESMQLSSLEVVNDTPQARTRGIKAAYDAREAAHAALQDAVEHQAELSSVDYAVKVLSAHPNHVMDVEEASKRMIAAGWETGGNVRNVTAAVLGKAVDKHFPRLRRVGRGQYVWSEDDGLNVPDFLMDSPSVSEETTGEARS